MPPETICGITGIYKTGISTLFFFYLWLKTVG